MNKWIAAYLRVSTDEQRKAMTIDMQRREIRRFCELHSIEAVFYEDDGDSGDVPIGLRQGGKKLLRDIADGKVSRVLVWVLDRLGRKMPVLVSAIAQIEELGAQVESTTEGVFSWDDPEKIMMTAVLCGLAAAEKAKIVLRFKTGSRNAAEKGKWTGGLCAFGYRPLPGEFMVISTEPIPGLTISESDVIITIFEKAARGDSCQKIAEHLTQIGVPTPVALRHKWKKVTRRLWRASSVRSLIINPTYKGMNEWGKTKSTPLNDGTKRRHIKVRPRSEWLRRKCAPIVTPELWERANHELHQNQKFAMAGATNEYLLQGLVKCGLCGYTYGGANQYYRCGGRAYSKRLHGPGKPPCTGRSVRRTDLEAAVWEDIAIFLSKPGLAIRQLEHQMLSEDGQGNRVADDLRQVEEALKRKHEANDRVVTLFSEGAISREEFNQQRLRIADESVILEARMAELRKLAGDVENRVRVLHTAESLLNELRDGVDRGLTFESRRRIVEALVESVTVEPVEGRKQPNIRVRFRFEPHFQRYRAGAAKSNRVALDRIGARCGSMNWCGRGNNMRGEASRSRVRRNSGLPPRYSWAPHRSHI